MPTRNEQYWIDRATRRMDGYVLSAIEQAQVINRAYNQTCAYVQAEIAKILRHIGDKDSLAYEYRMKRLNALLADVERRMKDLYGINLTDTTAFLKSIIPAAYYHTIFDVAQGIGQQPAFSRVNTRLIDTILKEPWSGTNYSKRIWSNTEKLAGDIRQVLTESAMSGESIYKTSRKLSEAFATTEYNSTRLIRTETTYACNRAEMTAYDALDIDRYKFVATLDTRTSTICQKLDGKIFKTKDAQAGKNLPAMHPNCRSTTIPSFDEGMPEIRTARDKDGKRITVPANMTYPEWYEKYIKPYEDGSDSQKPSAPSKNKDTNPSIKTPQKQNKATVSKPAEINVPAPTVNEPKYKDTPIPPKINNQSQDSIVDTSSSFTPAKSIEEAEKFALENGVHHVNYSDLPLETANLLNEAAMTLPEDIRPAYIGSGKSVQKVTGKKFPRKEKEYYGVHMDVLQMHFGEYPNIEYDFEGGNVVGISTAYKTPEKIHKSKVEGNKAYAEKHDGHTQFFNENGRSTAFHEMGHIYADKKGIPEGFASDAERWLKESKCDMLKSTDEAWAEAWGAYHTKNPDLPDYIAEYVEKVSNAPIDNSVKSGIINYKDSSSKQIKITQRTIDSVSNISAFSSDELNREVTEKCREILNDLKNDKPGTEETVSIKISSLESEKRKGGQGEGTVKGIVFDEPYISVHNHPSGRTFSGRDIDKFAYDKDHNAMCVVGNNGKIYVLQKQSDYNWTEFAIKTLDLQNKKNYAEKVLKGAKKYGFKYYEG